MGGALLEDLEDEAELELGLEDEVELEPAGGGGLGGLGSGSESERVTTVTATTGLNFCSWPLHTRPSTAGNCLVSKQAAHPANLPFLSMAQEGTGTGGVEGDELDEEDLEDPGEHTLGENRGLYMSPFLIGLLPANFWQPALFITLSHCFFSAGLEQGRQPFGLNSLGNLPSAHAGRQQFSLRDADRLDRDADRLDRARWLEEVALFPNFLAFAFGTFDFLEEGLLFLPFLREVVLDLL